MANLREATANRLYGCDCHTPSPPLPSHMMPISVFEDMMYKVAYVSGYAGEKEDFTEDFIEALKNAQQGGGIIIQKKSIKDFPTIGVENAIYIDTGKKEIYFWQEDGYYKLESGTGSGGSDDDDNSGGNGGSDENPDNPSDEDEIIYEGGEL